MKAVKYICIVLLVFILATAYSSRTIENLTLTSVTLVAPFKGTIVTPKENFIQEIVRIRALTDLIFEDVYINVGDKIKVGTAIASLYPASINRLLDIITDTNNDIYQFLLNIKQNDYILKSDANGEIIELTISTDSHVNAEDIIYKYIPEGALREEDTLTIYETIVPLSALTPTSDKDKYRIYYAVPLTGKGEEGQYIVIMSEVKVLAADSLNAALDMNIWDDRQIIISSEKPISHMQKVKAG